MKLPPLTQQLVLHVDGTPDEGYPLRILEAYRQQCNSLWAENSDGAETMTPIYRLMNEHQTQRAALLDAAIATLRQAPGGPGRPAQPGM